jgi:hypothetical protein
MLVQAADRLLLARTMDGASPDDFLKSYLKSTGASEPSVLLANGQAATQNGAKSPASAESASDEWTLTVVILANAALGGVGFWRVNAKAGLPGWGCLVPIYNLVLFMRLAGKPGWWAIWLFVPFLNFVIYTIVTFEVAKNFGKGVAYTLGLLLCPPLFYALLGLGHAQYNATLLRLRQQAATV